MILSEESLRKALSDNIRKLREHRGLSQPQLAKKLGWSQSKISQIETGKRKNVKPIEIVQLAQFFDIPIDFLFK